MLTTVVAAACLASAAVSAGGIRQVRVGLALDQPLFKSAGERLTFSAHVSLALRRELIPLASEIEQGKILVPTTLGRSHRPVDA